MALSFQFRKIRLVLPLVLLVMILMRLVWVNLRHYQPLFTLPAGLAALELAQTRPTPCAQGTWEKISLTSDFEPLQASDLRGVSGSVSPGLHWLGSGLCRLPEFAEGIQGAAIIKWNQWLLLATVFLGIVLGRFLTSSWNLALIGGVVLLSRGSFLREIQEVGNSLPLAFATMLWFVGLIHHFRTGSKLSAVLLGGASFLALVLDPVNLGLAMALPTLVLVILISQKMVLRPAVRRVKELRWYMNSMGDAPPPPSLSGRLAMTFQWLLGPIRDETKVQAAWQPNLKAGVVFRTIDVPYAFWLLKSGRGFRHFWLWFGALAAATVMTSYLYGPWFSSEAATQIWGRTGFGSELVQVLWQFWGVVDLHYGISLCLLLFCACQYPADGLISFQEAIWTFWIILVVSFLLAAFLSPYRELLILQLQDFIGNDTFAERSVGTELAHWLEPVILVLGVSSAYHLIKVQDSQRLRRLMGASRA